MGAIKIRTLVVLSAVAAVISVLTGGISGVPFLRILLRSIISAVGFAGLIYLLAWLLQKFLPELFQEEEKSTDVSERMGDGVNILMDQDVESPAMENGYAQTSEMPRQESVDEEQVDSSTQDSNTQEIKPKIHGPQEDFNNPQELPDIESFSSGFTEEKTEDKEAVSGSISSSEPLDVDSSSGSSISLGPTAEDEAQNYFKSNSSPEEMAKAIRTVVKRDED